MNQQVAPNSQSLRPLSGWPSLTQAPPTGTGFRGMKYGFDPLAVLASSPYPLTAAQLGEINGGAKLKDALTEQQFEHVRHVYAIHCRRYEYGVGDY